jgi:hypothetical protein
VLVLVCSLVSSRSAEASLRRAKVRQKLLRRWFDVPRLYADVHLDSVTERDCAVVFLLLLYAFVSGLVVNIQEGFRSKAEN